MLEDKLKKALKAAGTLLILQNNQALRIAFFVRLRIDKLVFMQGNCELHNPPTEHIMST